MTVLDKLRGSLDKVLITVDDIKDFSNNVISAISGASIEPQSVNTEEAVIGGFESTINWEMVAYSDTEDTAGETSVSFSWDSSARYRIWYENSFDDGAISLTLDGADSGYEYIDIDGTHVTSASNVPLVEGTGANRYTQGVIDIFRRDGTWGHNRSMGRISRGLPVAREFQNKSVNTSSMSVEFQHEDGASFKVAVFEAKNLSDRS